MKLWRSLLVVGLGIAVLVAANLWRTRGADRVTRLPATTDVSLRSEGTAALHLDTALNVIAEPVPTRARVEQHVRVDRGASSDSRLVIDTTTRLAGGQLFDVTSERRDVLDRETGEYVADERAWAYADTNLVDRSGSYGDVFPADLPAGRSVLVYDDRIGAPVTADPDPLVPAGRLADLDVRNYVVSFSGRPLVAGAVGELSRMLPLGATVGFDQAKPLLRGAGLDLDALFLALLNGGLSEADGAILTGLTQQPLPMSFLLTSTRHIAVEPTTGSVVAVTGVDESIATVPDPTVLRTMKDVLARYPAVPEAVTASATIDAVLATPLPVLTIAYAQTDASVRTLADLARDQKRRHELALRTVPDALRTLGIVVTIAGVVFALATIVAWALRRARAGRRRLPV